MHSILFNYTLFVIIFLKMRNNVYIYFLNNKNRLSFPPPCVNKNLLQKLKEFALRIRKGIKMYSYNKKVIENILYCSIRYTLFMLVWKSLVNLTVILTFEKISENFEWIKKRKNTCKSFKGLHTINLLQGGKVQNFQFNKTLHPLKGVIFY